jgi:glycosyltransferase involved in cell wall biosynthesis
MVDGLRIAVLIPCFNEEKALPAVLRDFRRYLPSAILYVCDNNSTDQTVRVAKAGGALVTRERLQGKGHAVRRLFADVEADIYILVDGDDTYDAADCPRMIDLLLDQQVDLVNGVRIGTTETAYRRGHRFGNAVLTGIVQRIFGNQISDMLSGYRVMTRRFVKSFPILTGGFELETELSVHALELKIPMTEIRTKYKPRQAASLSKLHSYSDGLRILHTIMILVKEERPFHFFSIIALALLLIGISFGIPVVIEFIQSGLVPRFPSAILATGLVLLSSLCFTSGLILDTVTRARRELKRLAYLAIPATRHLESAEGRVPAASGISNEALALTQT